jgi:hypothetical protein
MRRVLSVSLHRVTFFEPVTEPINEQRHTVHLSASAGIEVLGTQRDEGALVHPLGQRSQLGQIRSTCDLAASYQPLIDRVRARHAG